jgi:hypothetical protein
MQQNAFEARVVGRRFVGGSLELDLLVGGSEVKLRCRCSSSTPAREGEIRPFEFGPKTFAFSIRPVTLV